MAVREHIARLNEHFTSVVSPAFSSFSLEEDTVSFKVSAGVVCGEVSVSLFERSSYPRTGALAFSDGSDELTAAIESITSALEENAALDRCLTLLGAALGNPDGLSKQLSDLPSGCASAPRASGASSSSAPAPSADDSDEDAEEEEGDDGNDDDEDDDEQANLDYDFARGAELENSLLRLRHQWELKDQERREQCDRAREEEEAASAAAIAAAPQKRKRLGADGKQRGAPKQGAHQIFSSAEATRMLCNELFDLMKEEREGFDGVKPASRLSAESTPHPACIPRAHNHATTWRPPGPVTRVHRSPGWSRLLPTVSTTTFTSGASRSAIPRQIAL